MFGTSLEALILGVVVCTIIGFVTAVRWLARFAFGTMPPSPSSGVASLPASASVDVNREAVRLKLEDLYFQKLISPQAMQELQRVLKLRPTIQDPAPIAAAPSTPTAVPLPASTPNTEPPPPQPIAEAPFTSDSVVPVKSGFFSSENIKTLLVSGCSLFVLSAYLFVRSYWSRIPDGLKFAALAAVTAGIYALGRRLLKGTDTPKTAETLLALGCLLVPFNFYAANVLLFNHSIGAFASWAWGCVAMGTLAGVTSMRSPTWAFGCLTGAGFIAASIFGGFAAGWTDQIRYFVTVITTFLVMLANLRFSKSALRDGGVAAVNAASFLTGLALISEGFFIKEPSHLLTTGTLIIMGIQFAVQARVLYSTAAYIAGLCLMTAGAVALHHFHVPSYKYGLFFVPASLLAILRGWSFEKNHRSELAQPYFLLGHFSLAGSMVLVMSFFGSAGHSGFITLLATLAIGSAAYAALTLIYRQPIYTYASALTFLLIGFSWAWHHDLPFALSCLLLAAFGGGLVLLGLGVPKSTDETVAVPLNIVGLATLTLSLAFIAAESAGALFQGKTSLGVSPEQLTAGLWVGGLSALAYALLAVIRREVTLVFPALASLTIVYIFGLEKLGLPINLFAMSWIVVGSMALSYTAMGLKQSALARCFSGWAELIFVGVAVCAFLQPDMASLKAVALCAACFVPCIFVGGTDLATSFLTGIYLSHYIWCSLTFGTVWRMDPFRYASHLLILTTATTFVRSLVTYLRPTRNIEPFRVFALAFSVIALLTALGSRENAWQIYLAYSVLAFAVSALLYNKRYWAVSSTLAILAYELYLWSHHVTMTEAYTFPMGLYVLALGYFARTNRDLRNFLYGVAQFILFVPSFGKALGETWEFHGIYLGVMTILVLIFGMSQRNRCLVTGSLCFLLLNGTVQSIQFLTAVPRWIYLGLGGALLVSLGGLFEFQREILIRTRQQVASAFEGWD